MIYNAYQDSKEGLFSISVVSAGHIFAQQGRKISRPKGRKDYLLFYVAKGSELFYLDSQVELKEGSFVIFRPNEKQEHIQNSSKISEFYYVHFNAPEDFDLFSLQSSKAYFGKPASKFADLFEELINELLGKEPFYEQLCASKLVTILLLLKRRDEKSLTSLNRHGDKIYYIVQNMNKEYHKNYTLEEYAQMCCMSKFHFLRVFKNITGCSPIEYRNAIRLEHAKDLLLNTESTISEISLNSGFVSNAYFSNAFKSKFNMSPGMYRKMYK